MNKNQKQWPLVSSKNNPRSISSMISIEYKTQYSVVFYLTSGEVKIVTEKNYRHPYYYQLPMK